MKNNPNWKYNLHNGDEIVIDTGDNELSSSIIIATIEYLPLEMVRIIDIEGQKHECWIGDIQ